MLALPPPFQLIVGAPGGLPEPKAVIMPDLLAEAGRTPQLSGISINTCRALHPDQRLRHPKNQCEFLGRGSDEACLVPANPQKGGAT
jgi:hypothetical protein